jgi:hypothetical protein
MADKGPSRRKSRAGRAETRRASAGRASAGRASAGRASAGRASAGRRAALGACALPAGALAGLAGLVACRYGGAPALAPPLHPPFHSPAQSPVIALGAVGLVCYTMFFLVCEAVLLVLAVINIQDEKVHNKYKSLMLLVLYVFTFRYRRVLPAKFFADDGAGDGIEAPPSPPMTDEELRAAFNLLLTRRATALGDKET